MDDRPMVPYWHLWTDAGGISRQKRCAMTEFELRSMKPPADPQWQGARTTGKMTVMVTVQPSAGSGFGMKTLNRNGLCRFRAAGSLKQWTALASKWARVRFLSVAIRIAARSMASVDTGRARSETFQPC